MRSPCSPKLGTLGMPLVRLMGPACCRGALTAAGPFAGELTLSSALTTVYKLTKQKMQVLTKQKNQTTTKIRKMGGKNKKRKRIRKGKLQKNKKKVQFASAASSLLCSPFGAVRGDCWLLLPHCLELAACCVVVLGLSGEVLL